MSAEQEVREAAARWREELRQEAADLAARIERLLGTEASLGIEGEGEAPVPPALPPGDGTAPELPPSSPGPDEPPADEPEPASEPPAGEPKRNSNAAREANRAKILRYVADHPGCSQAEMREEIGMKPNTCSRHVIALAEDGKLRKVGERAAQRLFPFEGVVDEPEPDEREIPKGELDAQITEAIGDDRLPAAQIAARVGRPLHLIRANLDALVIGRALTKQGAGGNAFYLRVKHPRTIGDPR